MTRGATSTTVTRLPGPPPWLRAQANETRADDDDVLGCFKPLFELVGIVEVAQGDNTCEVCICKGRWPSPRASRQDEMLVAPSRNKPASRHDRC
jgi:hypothetical protein